MKVTNPIIKKLLTHYTEISLLGKVKAVLDWDLNVNLPPKAAEGRAKQSEYLAQQMTKLWLEKDFRNNLEKANTITSLHEEEKAIVRNLNYGGKYYFNVPPEIIAQKERLSSKAFMLWKEAREKNEYKLFLPPLKELIELDKVIANHIGYKDNLYDALLDEHEPGLTAAFCQQMFATIKPDLIALVKKIQKSKSYVSQNEIIDGKYDYAIRAQKKIGQFAMQKMGYDFQAGRVDVSPHPFTTTLDHADVRITTAFQKNDFRSSYTAYMHETGHALYEQDVNPGYAETPLEGGVSFGIHEALSRFWENMIGRNPNFLHFMTPVFQAFYPEQLGSLNEDALVKLFHIVKPSFIRNVSYLMCIL